MLYIYLPTIVLSTSKKFYLPTFVVNVLLGLRCPPTQILFLLFHSFHVSLSLLVYQLEGSFLCYVTHYLFEVVALLDHMVYVDLAVHSFLVILVGLVIAIIQNECLMIYHCTSYQNYLYYCRIKKKSNNRL